MTRATVIADSLVHRLQAQLGPLGVDVQLHKANVLEMVQRLPGMVNNPAGLLVTWCNREADAHRARMAAGARDRDRYAELQVEIYQAIAARRFTPRELARVLTQATREGYPALNPRTIEMLRSMGDRWDATPTLRRFGTEGPAHASARDALAGSNDGTSTGRSLDAGPHASH